MQETEVTWKKSVSGIPYTNDLEQIDCWISPDGKFYGCEYGDHARLIDDVCDCSVEKAEFIGWFHISSATIRNSSRFVPTQSQLDTLFDIAMTSPCSERGRCLLEYLKSKGELER